MSNPGSQSHGPSTMFHIIILSREQYCLCLFRSAPIYIPLLLLLFHFIYIFRQQHFAAVELQFWVWYSPSMVMIIIRTGFVFQDFSFFFWLELFFPFFLLFFCRWHSELCFLMENVDMLALIRCLVRTNILSPLSICFGSGSFLISHFNKS